MRSVLLLIAGCVVLAGPGRAGTFRLYDCSGSLRNSCLSLFPGEAAPRAQITYADGRLIWRGQDLGRAMWGFPNEANYGYSAYLERGDYVAGSVQWEPDSAGRIAVWGWASRQRPGWSSYIEDPRNEPAEMDWPSWLDAYADSSPQPTDMNQYGDLTGAAGGAAQAFFTYQHREYVLNADTVSQFFVNADGADLLDASMMRINDHGQVLGYGGRTMSGSSLGMFVISPLDAPAPVPEPATYALLAGGLASLLAVRRWRR